MKARLSRSSALGALNPMQKKAVEAYLEIRWREKQEIICNRFKLAVCLVLADLYGFGNKRLKYVLQGLEDTFNAYASDSFSPQEARNGSIDNGEYDEMAARMQAELSSRRGMKIRIVGEGATK